MWSRSLPIQQAAWLGVEELPRSEVINWMVDWDPSALDSPASPSPTSTFCSLLCKVVDHCVNYNTKYWMFWAPWVVQSHSWAEGRWKRKDEGVAGMTAELRTVENYARALQLHQAAPYTCLRRSQNFYGSFLVPSISPFLNRSNCSSYPLPAPPCVR